MNSFLLSQSIQVWVSVRLLLISNVIFASVAMTSSVLVISNSSFDYNTIAMCLTYSMLLSSKFAEIVYFYCTVEQNIISVERIRQYFENPKENPD